MTRQCSHCTSIGRRTCTTMPGRGGGSGGGGGGGGGGLRLFGVRLIDGSSIKKSASMGNLSNYSAATSESPEGYHSDDPDHGFDAGRRKKKGIPWTEEEHRKFLLGLQKLGKGDWRGISKLYVPSRTPTQVASHAQKYFIRQTNATRKKKRTSLFDMVPNSEITSPTPEQPSNIPSPAFGTEKENLMLTSSSQEADANSSHPSLDLSLKPAFTPFPFELWPPNAYSRTDNGTMPTQEQPTRELIGLSQLSLDDTGPTQTESSPLSLRQPGMP